MPSRNILFYDTPIEKRWLNTRKLKEHRLPMQTVK